MRAGNYLFGEQDVRGKDSILQVKLMKELNIRTGNNQYKLLSGSEVVWIWIKSENCLFRLRPIAYLLAYSLGPDLVSDRDGKVVGKVDKEAGLTNDLLTGVRE